MEGQILTNAQDASSLQMGRFSSDRRVGSGGLGEEVCAIVAADLQSWGLLLPLCPPPPPTTTHSTHHPQRLHLFLIASPWKESRISQRRQLSHFDPPLLTLPDLQPLLPRHHLLSFKNLSPYYPYLFLPLLLSGGRASNPAIQVLVSAAPFSSAVTLSLSPRCPSVALTTPPLCINQGPNEPK